jgi:cell division protein FtsN
VRGATASLVDSTQSALNTSDEGKVDLAASVRPPTVVQPGDDPTKAPPPAPPNADGESGGEPSRETASAAKPSASEAAKPAPPAAAAAATKPAATVTSKPAAAAAAAETAKPGQAADIPAPDDPRQGWVVQVAATKTRGEADTMAKRLSAKGYSAFVLSGSADVFRVRVGGYKSRRDAETVATRLRQEERINPWVTR